MQATNPVVYAAHGRHLDGFNKDFTQNMRQWLRYLLVFRFVKRIRYANAAINRPTITATLIAFMMGTQFQQSLYSIIVLIPHGRWRVITVDTFAKIRAFCV